MIRKLKWSDYCFAVAGKYGFDDLGLEQLATDIDFNFEFHKFVIFEFFNIYRRTTNYEDIVFASSLGIEIRKRIIDCFIKNCATTNALVNHCARNFSFTETWNNNSF